MESTLKRSAGPKAVRAAVLASMLLAAAAQAGGARHKLVLSGYKDSAAGASLLSGHYDTVIRQLGRHGALYAGDEVAASTNLCVAYIMAGRWDSAHPACDEAIAVAKLDGSDLTIFERQVHDEQVALAYSNRAVLNWLENHPASAAEDLSKARALSPGSEFVAQNLLTLGSGTRVAAVVASHG